MYVENFKELHRQQHQIIVLLIPKMFWLTIKLPKKYSNLLKWQNLQETLTFGQDFSKINMSIYLNKYVGRKFSKNLIKVP